MIFANTSQRNISTEFYAFSLALPASVVFPRRSLGAGVKVKGGSGARFLGSIPSAPHLLGKPGKLHTSLCVGFLICKMGTIIIIVSASKTCFEY